MIDLSTLPALYAKLGEEHKDLPWKNDGTLTDVLRNPDGPEAITALKALEAENRAMREVNEQLTKTVMEFVEDEVELREALEPFAKAGEIRLCAGPEYWTDNKTIQGTDIAFHITFGDLRRAALAKKGADSND